MSEQAIIQLCSMIAGITTLYIGNHFRSKRSEKNINKNVKQTVQQELLETDKKQSEAINELKAQVSKVVNIVEINDFREQFALSFKKKQRNYIEKLKIENSLKLFLKSGVLELSNLFDFILQNKFSCEIEEFQSEVDNSESILRAKFKNQNICEDYAKIINQEITNFIFFMQDIKIMENGNRMSAFKDLCNRTAFKIITEIIKIK